jgi:predicted ATPase/DNA-binding CsgD family transcriptional regulator
MTDIHRGESNGGGDPSTLEGAEIAATHVSLPTQLSTFVGRERELGELREAQTGTRLLTLTGPGGCGKTRLGLQFASELADRFPDGVWWIELAPLAEEELVGAAVAEVLGVRPLPGLTELQAVCGYLASRRAMLVLDNCEHLLGACAAVAEAVLKACPEVAVLATSRAPIAATGETDWRVPPLSLPGEKAGAPADSDAVALFAERARKVSPGFVLTEENSESVGGLCRSLDGLPLAIELAAARLRMLSIEQIATGLGDRFRLLTGGPRSALERHQTLRASVDWSHELLSDPERGLLRRLAVFAGGFTLEAVDEVCAGDGIEREAVLDLIASLVEQSLVIAQEQESGKVRYRLLETVRQYGLERLAEAGEEETVRTRHRDHFLALAEEAGPQLETGRQSEFLELLDPEAANLAAAIDHAVGAESRLALRFCATLYKWWAARGRYAEAELAYSRSLEAAGDDEPALTALALRGRTYVAVQAGEFEAAVRYATDALALAEEVGDKATAARARIELGGALQFPNPAAGRSEMARGAELARASGDNWALVHAKGAIAGTYLWQQDYVRGAAANDEVAALAERVGDPFHVARRWLNSAWLAAFTGRVSEARDSIARGRAATAAGDTMMECITTVILAVIDIREGEPERTLARLEVELEHALKLGAQGAVPFLVTSIACAELAAGRPKEACEKLEGVLPLVEGRVLFATSWSLWLLAEARRLLDDSAAEGTAVQAQASGEQLGNPLFSTGASLTLGRLASARGEWTVAREHVLVHLDACAAGGHVTYVPGCLDALAEVAAGIEAHEDAVRLFGAAERARAEITVVRFPPEETHWAAIEGRLREALGEEDYEAARVEGAELSTYDAVEWARRARGPRQRPPGGWDSLTPTELRVTELVAEGLTNPQVGERMFISKATVKTHLRHIFRKLDVHSRSELSARAAQRDAARSSSPAS